MHSSPLQAATARFPPLGLRTSFRRSSTTSVADSNRSSVSSPKPSSPVRTINSVMSRQPSIVDLEEERKIFGGELAVLEPRPIVYWGSVEERMAPFLFDGRLCTPAPLAF